MFNSGINISILKLNTACAAHSLSRCSPMRLSKGLPITGLAENDFAVVKTPSACQGNKRTIFTGLGQRP